MLTGRAYAVLGGAALLWVTARLLGSSDLHMVSVGLLALVPLAAGLVRFSRPDILAVRRLSSRRVFPGTRVRVDLEVQNIGRRRTSVLIVQDRLPRALGSATSAVAGEIRPGARQHVGYSLIPRARGRYVIGPLTVWAADPFDLVRRRLEVDVRHDLVVYPEVEDLGRAPVAAPIGGAGDSSTRQLFRSGEDFYTMRAYEQGDDLRRIHWPSVAKSGELMIRQDEASRRAAAALFLDARATAMPRDAFERAVSATASIASLYLRSGFRLRFATPEHAAAPVDLDSLLDTLAVVRQGRGGTLTASLDRLAAPVSGALVVVTHVPEPAEIAAMTRLAPAAAARLAVLVTDQDRPQRPHGRHVDAARGSLARSGWEVLVLTAEITLRERWARRRTRGPVGASS